MKKLLLSLFLFVSALGLSQQYRYKINLANCNKDRVLVELVCPTINTDTAYFHFPVTIPGTYAVLNYGIYISNFKAKDINNKQLKVEKVGYNTYKIAQAKNVRTITYQVDDSWDSKEKKYKIFEPAGTGFQKGEYFYINNGALVGFFDNMLLMPFELQFIKPENLNGYSSLFRISQNKQSEVFSAENYHQLIDNPILFTHQKEERFSVANTDITIAAYYKNNDSAAYYIKTKINNAMNAIDTFVGGSLPVSNYTFLNYIIDLRDVGKIFMKDRLGFFQIVKLHKKMGRRNFGALEHGTSSSYFLPDFGKNNYTEMIYETAIHEFMHIYTPLNLHSEYIGKFDYVHPKMSKHLWLYEGVTEYFSVLTSMQGELEPVEKLIKERLKGKIVDSFSYPDSIPFTQMSEKVFDQPYNSLYGQVYVRGAVMAMLLDFEIMRLSEGRQTLKSIVFELAEKYGKDKSFAENEIIPMFVKMVHPDLQLFFDNYITGTKPLDVEGGFKTVGVNYQKEKKGIVPINILSKTENGIVLGNTVINGVVGIKKADEKNIVGLRRGDRVNYNKAWSCFQKENGEYIQAGETVTLPVMRKGKKIFLSFPAQYKEGVIKNSLEISNNKTPEQEKLFRLWTTGKS